MDRPTGDAAWLSTYLSRAVGPAPGTGAYEANALARLRDLRILIVGGGAVGGRTLEKLVRLGAGTGSGLVEVYDPDTADVSNLQRQCLTADDAATERLKADALVSWAALHVPPARVEGRAEPFTVALAHERVRSFDAVVMAADVSQPAVNLAVLRECVDRRVPVFGGLDLNRVAVHWHWTPRNQRSPLLRGLYHYRGVEPVRPMALDDVTTTDLDAVARGDKRHGLGWLAQMIDPADLPPSLLRGLVASVAAQQRGEPGFLPQAAVAADRQAQQTADTLVDWLARPDLWPDAASYVVFDPEAHIFDAAATRAVRWHDDALLMAVTAARARRAAERRRAIEAFLADPSPAARITRICLGVSDTALLDGRNPLVGLDGR